MILSRASLIIGTLAPLGLFAVHADVEAAAVMRDFRKDPPAVLSLAVTETHGAPGQGLLKVQFAERGLPASIPFFYQGKASPLRDDGLGADAARDGVYSALVDVTAAERAALQSGAVSASAALDPEKTLLIRSTSVVNNSRTSDPCLSNDPADAAKKWTFGHLMTQMANEAQTGISPSDLALSLLRQWERDKTVNGEAIPPRPLMKTLVTDKWLRASGNNGRLAMHKAPFRLLAIVNRIDLRENLFFGEGLAGELRFVWGVLDLESRAADGTCNEDPSFTMIMEYAVDRPDAAAVKAWGQKWADLNGKTLNSPEYREALQQITESVVKAGAGQPFGRANGSALIRIRTNEIALASPWELREFAIAKPPSTAAGRFVAVTTKQTPALRFKGSARLAKWVNDNQARILQGRHIVPMELEGEPFRGGHSFNEIDFWNAPGIRNKDARHLVSLNTCNGCHGGDAGVSFLHVFPRPRRDRSGLSGFLTGTEVPDMVDPTITRRFDDLARRAADLQALVSSHTLTQVGFQPLNRTH